MTNVPRRLHPPTALSETPGAAVSRQVTRSRPTRDLRRLVWALAMCLACLLAAGWRVTGPGASVACAAQDTGTYRIRSYVVSIAPEPDGSWIADYHQEWEVTGGHIPWVTVGLPDHDYVILSRGGAAAEVSRADYGSWSGVRVDLDADYGTGDVFDLSFRVRQESMGHPSGADAVGFEFVPGWYDRARVEQLEIRVKNPGGPEDVLYASPEPSQRTGEELVWRTSLDRGERFRVSFAFSSGLFPDLKAPTKSGAGAGGDGLRGTGAVGQQSAARRAAPAVVAVFALMVVIAVVILVTIIVALAAATRGGYTGRRGVYYGTYFPIPPVGHPSWGSRPGRSPHAGDSGDKSGGSRKSGGGGGFGGRAIGCACVSCACACVSCACACACAGGGGAGCARKFDGGGARPAHAGASASIAASPSPGDAVATAVSTDASATPGASGAPETAKSPGASGAPGACEASGPSGARPEARPRDRSQPGQPGAEDPGKHPRGAHTLSLLLMVVVAAGLSLFVASNAAGCVRGGASSAPQHERGPYDENVEVPTGDPAFPRLGRYWVVDPQGLVGERAARAADQTLEALRAAGLAETVIVVQPGVKHPADWSTHYGRWLMLGEREGSQRNNGLVFLIIPDARPEEGRVWYSVGRGLPRLTSSDLGPLIEEAASYANAGDLDGAVVSIARNIDDILRKVYGEGEQ